ncbi:MAG: hypothetical protein RML35_05085 [Chloroherpetonaceae bacterium]|nr:hypothetical protein [Chloroherpetonaceae bacterium]
MHLATFSLLLLGYATLFFATERGVAQSAELSASRLRSAPTSIKLFEALANPDS